MASVELPAVDALDLIAGAETAAFAMDRNERLIYWNSAAEKLFGWTADEVLGKACFSVLAGRDPFGNLYCMRDCAIMRSAIDGASVEPFLMDIARKRGGSLKVKVRVVPLPAAGKTVSCLMHLVERGEPAELERLVASLRTAARPAADSPKADPVLSVSPLTAREREIVVLLSNGYAALNIAAKLNLSHATVRNHIQNILRKLEVHSQVEAIAVAFRRGWI
ncbi:MAG TPA: LuxR C-terminal-related transcriptional regulator [Thermoanaerobaculia bacterium]|nr:LuxR C-terminal-related transcriptional regulator [Thermoanaerobaculia bacterium]